MQCSMLKGHLVIGVRQLWPRRNHLTRKCRWCNSGVQRRGLSSSGLQREFVASTHRNEFWESRKDVTRVSEETRFRKWGLRALDGSHISTNGDASGRRRIFTTPVRGDDEEEHGGEPLDAILVLAGGQLPGGGVPVWVERRLDKALELHKLNGPKCSIVCLGNGTPHRRPILTPQGFVVHESTSCAEYLIDRGAPVSVLLKEWGSYDTIGNGFFALTQHVIPRRWRRMAVVTSDFHMPRSHAIFEWVFGLQGAGTSIQQANGAVAGLASSSGSRSQGFMLQYHGVSDIGIEMSIIEARVAKERKALESLKTVSTGISTLEDFHVWFHTQHRCYNVEHQELFGKQPLNDPALQSY
ncbi:hypothetical protein KC19_10G101600 [Ceratodon purpureus]|uniref:DUF218 domain-containing protein n=1 Tax=Ceratodon purpureus TaxID=3225 RepID=A0A8T0GIW7_CERPU|nr:hypothetical protein KC19_10G101600 [Ceratodon purpureus]